MASTVPVIFHDFISCKMNNVRENFGYKMCYAIYYWEDITDEEKTDVEFSVYHGHRRGRILAQTLDI